jgi:hypothetical protein
LAAPFLSSCSTTTREACSIWSRVFVLVHSRLVASAQCGCNVSHRFPCLITFPEIYLWLDTMNWKARLALGNLHAGSRGKSRNQQPLLAIMFNLNSNDLQTPRKHIPHWQQPSMWTWYGRLSIRAKFLALPKHQQRPLSPLGSFLCFPLGSRGYFPNLPGSISGAMCWTRDTDESRHFLSCSTRTPISRRTMPP